jgi:hypothetical protein
MTRGGPPGPPPVLPYNSPTIFTAQGAVWRGAIAQASSGSGGGEEGSQTRPPQRGVGRGPWGWGGGAHPGKSTNVAPQSIRTPCAVQGGATGSCGPPTPPGGHGAPTTGVVWGRPRKAVPRKKAAFRGSRWRSNTSRHQPGSLNGMDEGRGGREQGRKVRGVQPREPKKIPHRAVLGRV